MNVYIKVVKNSRVGVFINLYTINIHPMIKSLNYVVLQRDALSLTRSFCIESWAYINCLVSTLVGYRVNNTSKNVPWFILTTFVVEKSIPLHH